MFSVSRAGIEPASELLESSAQPLYQRDIHLMYLMNNPHLYFNSLDRTRFRDLNPMLNNQFPYSATFNPIRPLSPSTTSRTK